MFLFLPGVFAQTLLETRDELMSLQAEALLSPGCTLPIPFLCGGRGVGRQTSLPLPHQFTEFLLVSLDFFTCHVYFSETDNLSGFYTETNVA